MQEFGIVVLAAGGSSRLGRPKQLILLSELPGFTGHPDKTLIEHVVETALASQPAEVVVVLGSDAEPIASRLKGIPVRPVLNENWEAGMGGSISCGVAALSRSIDRAVIALCDQPQITAGHFKRLAEAEEAIAATSYDGVLGAPCSFSRALFPDLLALKGDAGARKLIRNASATVMKAPFEGAALDMDRPADLGGRE